MKEPEDPEDKEIHREDQREKLKTATGYLAATTGDEFYKEHDEHIESAYQEFDDDHRSELRKFMSNLYKERRTKAVRHHQEKTKESVV